MEKSVGDGGISCSAVTVGAELANSAFSQLKRGSFFIGVVLGVSLKCATDLDNGDGCINAVMEGVAGDCATGAF